VRWCGECVILAQPVPRQRRSVGPLRCTRTGRRSDRSSGVEHRRPAAARAESASMRTTAFRSAAASMRRMDSSTSSLGETRPSRTAAASSASTTGSGAPLGRWRVHDVPSWSAPSVPQLADTYRSTAWLAACRRGPGGPPGRTACAPGTTRRRPVRPGPRPPGVRPPSPARRIGAGRRCSPRPVACRRRPSRAARPPGRNRSR